MMRPLFFIILKNLQLFMKVVLSINKIICDNKSKRKLFSHEPK